MADDDDSVLDLAEQHNRPIDNALNQQRIQAWHPILDPWWVTIALFYLGLIMVPAGFKFEAIQNEVVEMRIDYDDYDLENPECGITTYNEDRRCNLTFTAPKRMEPPILIHYAIRGFHQNHRTYARSRDLAQLRGYMGPQDEISARDCKPLNKLGNQTLNPCGLIANTFFNDIFTLVEGNDIRNNPLRMIETGIAWKSDLEYMFAQPDGFHYEECPQDQCDPSCCDGDEWSCKEPYVDEVGNCFRFFYPKDDTTRYLYETYPDIISPLEGVTNEHFVVWMRIATQQNFRKLYGWINQTIEEGTVMTFQVRANYMVTDFRGSKALMVGTTSIIGGRNKYIGPVFYIVGLFCLVAGSFFLLKQTFRPRKLADRSYLHYDKED